MANGSKNSDALRSRDLGYYRQRQKNRVFGLIGQFFVDNAERGLITRSQLACKLGKDPAQITRLLSNPSNVTLDTISDIMLAMDAEMDWQIVPFAQRATPNYRHQLAEPPAATSGTPSPASSPREETETNQSEKNNILSFDQAAA